ncbi:MAG TPA: PEGA domain-containing protein [Patescibacteria group bacterium]|nr:PEGA domain-containing protein [Patescibacteria group bacterium]
MEYPGAKFTKPFRLTILGVFIAAFLIISPAVILYSIGYRYDWQAGLLRETGAISIDVEPETTVAYLNNIRLKSRMPIRLNNITPGKYTIRLEAENYLTWFKEVEVKNKQTVYIKEINLIQKNEPKLVLAGNVINTALSADGKYLAYALSGNNNVQIKIRNTEHNTDRDLLTIDTGHTPYFSWAKNKNLLAVTTDQTSYNEISFYNADNQNPAIKITSPTGKTITKFQWNDSGEEIYYGLSDNTLHAFNLTSKQNKSLAIKEYADWFLNGSELWMIRPTSTTLRWEIVREVYGYFQKSTEFDTVENNELNILGVKKDAVLIKTGAGQEVTLVYSDHQITFNANKNLISKYNDWWLFWTPSELRTFNYNEEPALLTRSGETLKEVLPLDEYNALLLVWANKTTIIHPYYLVNTPLFEYSINHPVADTEKRILYYVTEVNKQNGLWSLKY